MHENSNTLDFKQADFDQLVDKVSWIEKIKFKMGQED